MELPAGSKIERYHMALEAIAASTVVADTNFAELAGILIAIAQAALKES